MCETCGDRPAQVAGQCRACYVYERRTGRPRSDMLAARERRRQARLDRAWGNVAHRLTA